MWRRVGSHGSGGYSPSSHRAGLCSLSEQSLWDLWWTSQNWRTLHVRSVSTTSQVPSVHSATVLKCRPVDCSPCGDSLRAGRSGYRIPVKVRFSAPVQTRPWAHPAICTMGTGSFPGVKWPRRGVEHPAPSNAKVKEGTNLYTSTVIAMSVRIFNVQTRYPLSDLTLKKRTVMSVQWPASRLSDDIFVPPKIPIPAQALT